MRGAKNPNALTDSHPCPKGRPRAIKDVGRNKNKRAVPWPISRSFLPLPCKLSPPCMWTRQQWGHSFCAGFWTLLAFMPVLELIQLTLFDTKDYSLHGYLRQELVYSSAPCFLRRLISTDRPAMCRLQTFRDN